MKFNTNKFYKCIYQAKHFEVDLIPNDCFNIIQKNYSEEQLSRTNPEVLIEAINRLMNVLEADDYRKEANEIVQEYCNNF